MPLELTDEEAQRLLEYHEAFHDDLRQALLDIEQDLQQHEPVIELGRFAALDDALDDFKAFTGAFRSITGEKLQEASDDA